MKEYIKVATDPTVWVVDEDNLRRYIDWNEYVSLGMPPVTLVPEAVLESISILGQENDEEE